MIGFVTGIYGSGKSTYITTRAHGGMPVYSVDWDVGYEERPSPDRALAFLNSIPNGRAIVDAIPFDPTWDTFNTWALERGDEVEVTCVVCSERTWRERAGGGANAVAWSEFWLEFMPKLGPACRFYSSEENCELTHDEALERVGYRRLLRKRLEASPEGYDWTYQSIPEIGFKGYSGSEQTWLNMPDLFQWKGQTVLDLGCNHGFMMWRARECGAAHVIGLDQSAPVLQTANAIRFLRGDREAELHLWEAGQPTPEADVALCLNMLHHVADPAAAVAAINAWTLLTEMPKKGDQGQDLTAAIQATFPNFDTELPSHREGRTICIFRK